MHRGPLSGGDDVVAVNPTPQWGHGHVSGRELGVQAGRKAKPVQSRHSVFVSPRLGRSTS